MEYQSPPLSDVVYIFDALANNDPMPRTELFRVCRQANIRLSIVFSAVMFLNRRGIIEFESGRPPSLPLTERGREIASHSGDTALQLLLPHARTESVD